MNSVFSSYNTIWAINLYWFWYSTNKLLPKGSINWTIPNNYISVICQASWVLIAYSGYTEISNSRFAWIISFGVEVLWCIRFFRDLYISKCSCCQRENGDLQPYLKTSHIVILPVAKHCISPLCPIILALLELRLTGTGFAVQVSLQIPIIPQETDNRIKQITQNDVEPDFSSFAVLMFHLYRQMVLWFIRGVLKTTAFINDAGISIITKAPNHGY